MKWIYQQRHRGLLLLFTRQVTSAYAPPAAALFGSQENARSAPVFVRRKCLSLVGLLDFVQLLGKQRSATLGSLGGIQLAAKFCSPILNGRERRLLSKYLKIQNKICVTLVPTTLKHLTEIQSSHVLFGSAKAVGKKSKLSSCRIVFGALLLFASLFALMSFALPGSGVASAEGRFRRLDQVSDGHCANPVVSPDGKKIAYERRNDALRQRRILLLDRASGAETVVKLVAASSASLLAQFRSEPIPVLRDFAWTPAGPVQARYPYAVAASRAEQDSSLYLAGLGRLTSDNATEGHPTWSPNGSQLVYVSSRSGEGDLYAIDLTSDRLAPVRLTATEHEAELFPQWSPTGSHLCFVRHTEQGDNLFLRSGNNLVSAEERQLTHWTSTQTKPSFSPDGSKIAFFSNRRDPERFDLYVQSLSIGQSPQLLAKNIIPPERHGPNWHPDGKSILVVLELESKGDPLAWVGLASSSITVIPTETIQNRDPDLFSDAHGLFIVFTARGQQGDDNLRQWQRLYGGTL